MNYARHYSRVVRFGASSQDVVSLLRAMTADPDHLVPGSNLRLVTADALDDLGRGDEAAHMRSHLPLSIRDGRVQTSTIRLHRMLRQMRNYWGGEHIMEGEPTQLRLEAAKELERIGRHHEAEILRSQHPITTNTVYPTKRDSHTVTGDYPRFAHGGGEVVYHTRDGGLICHDCRNGGNGSMALHPEAADDRQWQVAGDFVHEEGPPIHCDHCNREITSAYGDPDEEADDGE